MYIVNKHIYHICNLKHSSVIRIYDHGQKNAYFSIMTKKKNKKNKFVFTVIKFISRSFV